jgi:hypothetical protein
MVGFRNRSVSSAKKALFHEIRKLAVVFLIRCQKNTIFANGHKRVDLNKPKIIKGFKKSCCWKIAKRASQRQQRQHR